MSRVWQILFLESEKGGANLRPTPSPEIPVATGKPRPAGLAKGESDPSPRALV